MSSETTPLTSTGAARSPVNDRKRFVVRAATIALVAVGAITGLVWIQSSGHSNGNVVHVRTTNADAPATFPGADDEILNLPGKPATYTSRLFSGYMPISNGGQGFYFLAESQSETPQTDPVLLWLNGGPGASSLEGCFSENGPLLVNEDGTSLRVNEFGWNKRANMVCIESPVGVGFSYNTSGIYKSDDDAQAEDLYWMLQAFFDKFPWLRQNDFIMTGESYGGIYVPTTAKRIVEGNAEFKDDPSRQIKLKKFAVGNGVNEYMSLSKVEFAYTHGLISSDQFNAVGDNCPELLTPGTLLPDNHTAECDQAIAAVDAQVGLDNLNPYNIYSSCSLNMTGLVDTLVGILTGPPLDPPHPLSLDMPGCLGMHQEFVYFNSPDVREAMHASPIVKTWSAAATTGNFDIHDFLPNATDADIDAIIKNKLLQYTSTHNSVVTPTWTFLLDHGIDGVIYHGDVDIVCDFIGGLWSVESLKLPRQQPRSIWTVPGKDQTAGFYEDFGHLKYVTVRGSGHMVPTDKPEEAKAMLDQFILN